jgi:hypothetical protein
VSLHMQGWNNWLKEASAGSRLRPHTHAHLIVIPWGVLPDRARHSPSVVPSVARQGGALVHGGDGVGGDRGVQLAVWLGVLRDDLIRGHCVRRAGLQSGTGQRADTAGMHYQR